MRTHNNTPPMFNPAARKPLAPIDKWVGDYLVADDDRFRAAWRGEYGPEYKRIAGGRYAGWNANRLRAKNGLPPMRVA